MVEPGLVIVDKSAGMTSHDVVARLRRLAGTKRVGHAGTLDPMATGVLIIGLEKATRLLGYLTLTEKEYSATIRLGAGTVTDDAEGEIVPAADPAPARAAGLAEADLRAALAGLTGEIMQVPPKISAIKVGGKRAYHLTRSGAAPELAARPVTVRRIDVRDIRTAGEMLDLDVDITCSSGTYIRAIARDLGAALRTGGHLTALRRTRVGPYLVSQARTLDQLADSFEYIPLAQAAAAEFPSVVLGAQESRLIAHGVRLPAGALDGPSLGGASLGGVPGGGAPTGGRQPTVGPVAAFDPDGTLIALLDTGGPEIRPVAVFVP